jgi:hypothetical protein
VKNILEISLADKEMVRVLIILQTEDNGLENGAMICKMVLAIINFLMELQLKAFG